MPGYTDKDATLQLAAELERKAERRQAGLSDPFDDHRAGKLGDHLADFRRHLEAKANSEKHVDQTNRIERVMQGCGFARWPDVSPSPLIGWLADRRAAGEMGVKTSNYYLAAFKEFCTWMVRDRRAAANPLSRPRRFERRDGRAAQAASAGSRRIFTPRRRCGFRAAGAGSFRP